MVRLAGIEPATYGLEALFRPLRTTTNPIQHQRKQDNSLRPPGGQRLLEYGPVVLPHRADWGKPARGGVATLPSLASLHRTNPSSGKSTNA